MLTSKSEQLQLLKEEERLMLQFRSRINDQLNRLKVEELTLVSLMRKAQEDEYAREEAADDSLRHTRPDFDEDEEDDQDDADDSFPASPRQFEAGPRQPPVPSRDISHLTSMTGGFRVTVDGREGGEFGENETTTFEVDLGDFEGGDGTFGMAGQPLAESTMLGDTSLAMTGLNTTPLQLGFGGAANGEEEEEDEDDELNFASL